MNLSDTLRAKLVALRNSSGVEFDSDKQHFVDSHTRQPRRGLTKILAQLIPVPYDTYEEVPADLSSKKPRKSRNDPLAEPVVSRYAGTTMQKCAACCDAAVQWLRQGNTGFEQIGERLRAEKHADKAHGIAVDYQLEVYVQHGREGLFARCGAVDPCVGTLLEHFDARGWAIVATQVPVYSAELDLATAIDILATDRATRTKLYLVEVKATRRGDVERSNAQYERLRGRLRRTTLQGMPLSYYSRHNVQVFCMKHIVYTHSHVAFDDECIARVSPGTVRTYALHAYFQSQAAKIVRAIALKTGRIKARRLAGAKRKRTTV